uniref:3-phosphoshikimate 1-carboxyvinyltransferase n=1 Tax=Candidatus Kentrum sp. FM TaxID=2126340 RepID=A0A450SR81_9GAMM|nr:MAG: 3-phosphoshikimate 1-carboxyvinyltransferase [Candidatus Kentron sp. FM]VFJ56490.1 MAG: 3-phosphoshikimate 1-carboxyvinyltransferase [Candidatus Kentron sp. FM]VFK08298.1 MAG: 3-phosphoshikimate 1-carboxyvinyltransferase [Candidatus Kentron sp. FM]
MSKTLRNKHNSSFSVTPGGALRGRLRVPGDKSISHRAIILGALAEGDTEIAGFLEGQDTLATVAAFRDMGVGIETGGPGEVRIRGVGTTGLSAPSGPLYLGNSGTSLRLLAGVLAGQRFASELVGDASLSRRPMTRIAAPLGAMGAGITTSAQGTPPVRIRGGDTLSGIDYEIPIPSAQVKSCLLLAGLFAKGETCVRERVPTRDHTERMLMGFGYPGFDDSGLDDRAHGIPEEEIWHKEISNRICIAGGGRLRGTRVVVPGDISSAAFFLVGAAIAAGSELILENVGVNPARTGVIRILRMMGADITLLNETMAGAEPVADIRVRAGPLRGVRIPAGMVSLAIDEFPALFIAAACAEGETTVTGAGELRSKESDRIAVMAEGLQRLGVDARPTADGMIIRGSEPAGGRVASHGDHRVAMAFAMAGLVSRGTVVIEDCANVDTSFPGFADTAAGVGLRIVSVFEE